MVRVLPCLAAQAVVLLGGRTPAAAAAVAAAASAAFPMSTSHSAPSISTAAAGPCVVTSGAPGPSSTAPPAAVIASSAPALPICQSSATSAAAQSTGLGGLIPAAATTSEDPAMCFVSASYSAPPRSDSSAGPYVVAPGDAAAQRRPRLLNLANSVDGDGDVQTHDGPVDKAKLAAVPTTLPGSTGRNPEK